MYRQVADRLIVRGCIVITLAISLTSLGGCTTTKLDHGADAKAIQEVKIEKGVTTLKELTDKFGEPDSIVDRGDGTRMLAWSGVRGTAHSNMVGMLVPFAPINMKYNGQTASLQVTVNQSDIVIDYTRTTGDMKMHDMDIK